MGSGFSIVHPADVPTEQFNTCEPHVRKLTEPLGCVEMRVNQVIVEAGEVTTPHTHEGQRCSWP
jgi:quercetin dioxygenase-like cupin family protein